MNIRRLSEDFIIVIGILAPGLYIEMFVPLTECGIT